MAGWASCNQSNAQYRSSALHWPTPSTRPNEELADSSRSKRCVASFDAGSITRATSMAINTGCNSVGAEPNQFMAPEPRALPSTAATWPWGKVRSTVKTSAALGTATPPRSSTFKPSITSSDRHDRLARVRLQTLPASR